MSTIQEIWEQDRKNHFGYCNIDKYHAQGYKGKGIVHLDLENEFSDNGHGGKVKKVYLDVAPEAVFIFGTPVGKTDGTRIASYGLNVDGVVHDFETFVVENNVKVMNYSREGGTTAFGNFLKEFIVDKHGVILTVSSGNDYGTVRTGLAEAGLVITAVNYNNGSPKVTGYSNKGESVDFCGFAHLFTGTSFSSPFVNGEITLLLNKYGDFNQPECVEILKSIAMDLGDEGKDPEYGWGLPILPLTDKLEILEKLRGENMANFKDVEETRWSKEAIDFCVERGLLVGFEDGTFRPTEFVTREQFAVILQRILNL